MGKLQPNFSWQKYEKAPEDQAEQFQYQLQSQHIETANSLNSTIDDESFFLRERQTSFTWVNSKPIYTKTLATVAWVAGVTSTTPLGIVGDFTVIDMVCCVSDGAVAASNTLLLPHIDVAVAANEISIVRSGTNIVITSGGTNRSAFTGYVTVYYIKN
jgi:hypothetical protein